MSTVGNIAEDVGSAAKNLALAPEESLKDIVRAPVQAGSSALGEGISSAFSSLAELVPWQRIGFYALGLLLVIVGLVFLLHSTGVPLPKAAPIPVPVPIPA